MTSMRAIVDASAAAFDVTPAEVLGAGRNRSVVLARQTAMLLARRHTRASLLRIGMLLRRDHTTVLHGARAMAAHIATDEDLAETVAQVERNLNLGDA